MNYARLLVTTTLLARATIGAADPNETADAALKRGHAAAKAGRIHEACEAYETSDKLAASVDTELALADCYEQDGKPMSAARLYRSVAERDENAGRRKTSSAKAATLEARAPKLRFAINPVPPGLVVKVDGALVSSTEDVLVDTGPHDVVATAPGFEGHASAPVDREHAIVDVIIRMQPHAEPAPAPTPTDTPAPAATTNPTPAAASEPASAHRKRNGLIVGGIGVGMLVGTGVLAAVSTSKFDDEHALCPSSRCANDADLAKAQSILSTARTERGVAIGMGIGGGVLLVVGSYLLLTPHTEETHVSLRVDHTGAGIGYTGRF